MTITINKDLVYRTSVKYHVFASDLQNFIQQEYGYRYAVIPHKEWANDCSHIFRIYKSKYSPKERENLIEFAGTGKHKRGYLLKSIMRQLCNKGRIPEGIYIIEMTK